MAEESTINTGTTTETSTAAQPTGFQAPAEWAQSEDYKPFFKEDKSFDVQALAKSYVETKSKIPVAPAKAEDYSFEFPKDYPLDAADLKLQKELAKNLGLTQAQYEGVIKHDLSRLARASEDMAKEVEKAKSELVKEWGGPQKFEANLAMVDKAAEQFFGKEAFTEDALRNNPVIIRGLFKIAQKLTEGTTVSGSSAGVGSLPLGEYGTPIFPTYLKTTPGPKR